MLIGCMDIETIPMQNMPAFCQKNIEDGIKFGNLGEEKRAEKLAKKMSTNLHMCQVCTFVGTIYDTDTRKVVEVVSLQDQPESEWSVINGAFDWLRSMSAKKIPLVTYNGLAFDVPILKFRAMYHDIPVDMAYYGNITEKWKATKHHYDLMMCLVNFDRYASFVKLDYWLHLYGITPKTGGMDGSQVWPAWQVGEFEKIQKYCEQDVLSTCKLFARVEHWIKIT